jgi:hypothetical protein
MWGDTNGKTRTYECGNWRYNGARSCEGTKVREHDILAGIAEHLDHEFLSLDGEALEGRALNGELNADDLPQAFARVKQLVAPPQ